MDERGRGTSSLEVSYVDIEREGAFDVTQSAVLCEYFLTVIVNGVPRIRLACTPTDVVELVVGRLFTDGLIGDAAEVRGFTWDEASGTATVTVPECVVEADAPLDEATTVTSHREAVGVPQPNLVPYEAASWSPETVFALYDDFAADTPLHALTAGTHSCRVAWGGEKVYQAEDIGRHNALDKAIGWLLLRGIDPREAVVFSSGRVPADMARKAIRACLGVLATKAAPTDQAVALARRYGLSLVCTVKRNRLRVFSD